MDDFNKMEEDFKTQEAEKKKTQHKVSGRSVFKLKKIIENKKEIDKTETNQNRDLNE